MQGDQMWKGLPDPGKSKAKTEWWDKAGAGGQPVSHWMNFNRDSSADGIGLTFQRVLQRLWWGFEETEWTKGERHSGKFWPLAVPSQMVGSTRCAGRHSSLQGNH